MHFECQTITGATEEEIKKLRKGDFNGSDEIKVKFYKILIKN